MEEAKHPCFDAEAKHTHARVHLPVAPQCNIQCNYCNRKYDCVNESRPGVVSTILKPSQAVGYLGELNKRIKQLSVIGIAGPGDPFANPKETLDTMRLAHEQFPDKIFCLSTNGLNLEPYIAELARLNVSHVTLTINALDPKVLAKIYKWVRFEKKLYRGEAGGKLLLSRQLACIPKLKAMGITVKINSVLVPGVNENEIPRVAERCAQLGADVINCIPLIPTADTPFADVEKPDAKMLFRVRTLASDHLKLMSHCSRCRADAAGLLGQDMEGTHALMREFAEREEAINIENRPYVAVGTNEGMLVNLHLGEAAKLQIYRQTPNGFQWVEERTTPEKGGGNSRWERVAEMLSDCRALLVSGIGPSPSETLKASGLHVVEMTGLIDEGLEGIYTDRVIRSIAKQDAFRCGSNCKGNAQGCA